MFESALLEVAPRTRNQRRWTTLLSVALQVALAGVLLILPMIVPESIPELRFRTTVAVPRAQAATPEPRPAPAGGTTSKPLHSEQVALQQPAEVPTTIPTGPDNVPETPSSHLPQQKCAGGCAGGIPGGVPGGLGAEFVPEVRQQPDPTATLVVLSGGVTEGLLTQRVQPEYPRTAILARVQGQVVLRAVITRAGEIRDLRVVSGHPMLSPAAVAAVKQWRYRPYKLNGVPVEVETQVTVNFVLSER